MSIFFYSIIKYTGVMEIPLNFVYLIATLPFVVIWGCMFFIRKDLRQEMLVMSFIIGTASVLTSYHWWTSDWWRPLTITGTRVGFEDFIIGFTSGGIMSSAYEFFFKKALYQKVKTFNHLGLITLMGLVFLTELLIKSFNVTTFYASSIAMMVVGIVMMTLRKDLLQNAFISALLMTGISVLFYATILCISPEWIQKTYLPTLSGITIIGVPAEEFVFWFLAGFLFGPFYEYWKGAKLRAIKK